MISYREDLKCWWPDYDRDPVATHNGIMKKVTDLELTVKVCRGLEVVIQAGGHAGFWPIGLSKHFRHVLTFEPDEALYPALLKNTETHLNIYPKHRALSDERGVATFFQCPTAGNGRINREFDGPSYQVQTLTLDGIFLERCDAIFLDIEGSEPKALRGARELIKRHRPILHLEELPRSKADIRAIMSEYGYRGLFRIHGDFIYVPEEDYRRARDVIAPMKLKPYA